MKVALVTGSARRIGYTIAKTLHANGYNVVTHYHRSATEAESLVTELNADRAGTAASLQADLLNNDAITQLANRAIKQWGQLDLLVNNASSYYPTPLDQLKPQDWHELLGSNLKAPLELSSACASVLTAQRGSIINIVDSNVLARPIADHPMYSAAKAGLHGLTLSLAKDLAPKVRVNGVSPGAIMWAENERDEGIQQGIIEETALGRLGAAEDIANAVLFLAEASYITGYVMKVDGGKNIR